MTSRVLFVPLDERPCNLRFPHMQFAPDGPIELVTPPDSLLGKKKHPADVDGIYSWLERTLPDVTACVLSIDTLLYGGLLPSRLHHESANTLHMRVRRLMDLVRRERSQRDLPVFVFASIMRTPSYSSDDEEPPYYEDYGEQLFRLGVLQHKRNRRMLGSEEHGALTELEHTVPPEVIRDWTERRRVNLENTRLVIRAVADGLFDYLVLPQDDTSPLGYSAMDWEQVDSALTDQTVRDRVLSYPGSDELGCVLTARAALTVRHKPAPNVSLVWRDEAAAAVVPPFESVPLGESIREQIRAAGARVFGNGAHSGDSIDIVLFVNTPNPDHPVESSNQVDRDHSRAIERLGAIVENPDRPRVIAVADVAYPNGAEAGFVRAVTERGLWPHLDAFAAWNTSGNTLGTVIARAVVESAWPDRSTRERNVFYRVADDWAYQTVLRRRDAGRGFDVEPDTKQWAEDIDRLAVRVLPDARWRVQDVVFPWNRPFEVGLVLESRTR